MRHLKSILSATAFSLIAIILSSCGKTEIEYDKTLLTGKWQCTTLFEVYNANGTGHTWDEADDITEAEAQKFTWTLTGDDLTQIHIMEMGGSVPKTYIVTNLTATTLSYKDELSGKERTFKKVN